MRIVIRILIWSLLVGIFLAWLGWTPGDLMHYLLDLLGRLPNWIGGLFGWAWPYIRQGAIIVIPIAVILLILGGRRATKPPRQ